MIPPSEIPSQLHPIQVGERRLCFGERTYVMGILNVTPDSFSDGGRFTDSATAAEAGLRLWQEGSDVVDVGGESTRPGARAVEVGEEIDRVCPVIEGLRRHRVGAISVDTRKAAVAQAAIDAGAHMVNDVSGGDYDDDMAAVVARAGVPYVIMHTRDVPEHMQRGDIAYDDVVSDVSDWLAARVTQAVERGVVRETIVVDPGIGFGKTVAHNLQLTTGLGTLRELGHAVLYGPSRKSFIGRLLGGAPPGDRLEGTLATVCAAVQAGADLVRVHDVAQARRTLAVADAMWRAGARANKSSI